LFRLWSATFKIVVASVITGAGLSALDLSAAEILTRLGPAPERIIMLLEHGLQWAIPNIILGSLVIVPIWLVVYLLSPPRS
jgi:hypothetical protein